MKGYDMKVSLLGFYRRISLKTKLMVIAIIFIVYPIVIIGYFGYRNYADTMTNKAISDMRSSAGELTSLISDRMTKLSLFSVQILYDNTIYEANRRLTDGSFDYEAVNDFNAYLQSNLYLKSEIDEILVKFTRSDKVFQVNKNMGFNTESYIHMDELYKQALPHNGKPVWYVSYKDGKAEGLYITKIIYDINDIKNEIGLLVFKVNEQYLAEVLNNYMTNTKQNVSLYGSDGREVFSYEPLEISSGKQIIELAGSGTGAKEVRVGDDTVYLLNSIIPPDDWKLVMVFSSNILLKDVRDIARLILILCVATLPICLLLVNFLYSDIIKPVNLLMKRMHQIEKGDIGITIENKRADEFGYMNMTFNRMSLEIKNLINTVYKKQIATKDAEIKALLAQINPHFLYNTLDSINWKAKINGVEEISEMVSALSSIIEANLNRNNENFISLDREIEYINNYYLLLKKRYGRKINLVMEVEPDTLECVIPKLIVQPIVENAVYHGLEMKVGNGTICLKARRDETHVYIDIIDDGIGIDENTLYRLNESLEEVLNETAADGETGDGALISSSIGIINVHKRIRLLYGDEYGLHISSRIAEGTHVSICLPAILKKTDENGTKGADLDG
jgi:two-component system sensor histidine kinase YesM